MLVRKFLEWSHWTKTEYDEADTAEVDEWWHTWLVEMEASKPTE